MWVRYLRPKHKFYAFRLVAEKINKNERKNKAEIITDIDACKTSEFWLLLGEEDDVKPQDPPEVCNLDANFRTIKRSSNFYRICRRNM